MRHDRHAVISGANPISVTEAACARGLGPRREPARSRAPANFNNSDGGSLADASHYAHMGRWCVCEYGRRPIQKARDRFPGAGSNCFCDDDDMPVICPTCQTLKLSVAKFYSNPCTGGALLPAASAGFAIGSGALAAAASSRVAALACLARWRRERDAERLTPQECAIAGPAVYPIKAPATAPTGPSTTAPETAPKAALPARSCAFAPTEKNDAAITATTSSFFIAISLCIRPQGTTLRKCGGRKMAAGITFSLRGAIRKDAKPKQEGIKRNEKTRGRFPGAGVFNSSDDGVMLVICPTRQIFFAAL